MTNHASLWQKSLLEPAKRGGAPGYINRHRILREQLCPPRPPVFFFPEVCEEDTAGHSALGFECAHTGLGLTCLTLSTKSAIPCHFLLPRPASLCRCPSMSLAASDMEKWTGPAEDLYRLL